MAVVYIDKCYIFGAGIYGKTALLELERQGTKILGYLDNNEAKAGKNIFHGKVCSLPGTLSEADRKLPVILANSKPEVRQVVRSELERLGYTDIRDYGMDEIYVFWKKIPDEECLRLQWAVHMGEDYKLDLEKPRTFNEKIQWLKLYDRNPLYTQLVDKYAVKQWVAERIGEEHVIPTLGVWEHFDDIDFSKLPDKFVLKSTHDSGGIAICPNKALFDKKAARTKLEKHLRCNYYYVCREWPYKNVPPRIIAEKYMEDATTHDLQDYKFFCFDGEPKAMFIATCRMAHEETKFDFYDINGQHLPFTNGHPNAELPPLIPVQFEKMKQLAGKLSTGIPHVRVDFYEVNGDVYFGEMTFSHWAGMVPFDPPEWDKTFGDWIHLPTDCLGRDDVVATDMRQYI